MSSSNPLASKTAQAGNCIPASQRPDGTWRKPRRVKDGYVPQEEVPLYESKGRQFAAKMSNNCPVGMPPELVAEAKAKRESKEKSVRSPIPGLILPAGETKKKKSGADELLGALAKTSLNSSSGVKKTNQPSTDPSKRLKSLRKKMREIEVLEEKLNNGEIENPEKDQIEKVKNKDKVLDEIAELEALVSN